MKCSTADRHLFPGPLTLAALSGRDRRSCYAVALRARSDRRARVVRGVRRDDHHAQPLAQRAFYRDAVGHADGPAHGDAVGRPRHRVLRARSPAAVGVHVDGAGFGTASEERILSRMRALFAAVAPDGLFNMTLSARTRPSAVTDTGIEQGVVVVDARVRVDRRGSFQSNIGRAR